MKLNLKSGTLFIILLVIGVLLIRVVLDGQSPKLTNGKEILQSLQDTLGIKEPIEADPRPNSKTPVYKDWVNPDGSIIPLKGYVFYTQKFLGDDAKKLADKTKEYFISKNFKEIGDDELNKLADKRKEYDISRGFEPTARDNYQFGKEDLKCILTVLPYEIVFCGVYDKAQDDLRKEFMKTLNPGNDPLVKFDVGGVLDNYAVGTSQVGYGYVWIAAKNGGEWKIIWRNQGVSCSFLVENSIPKELVGCR